MRERARLFAASQLFEALSSARPSNGHWAKMIRSARKLHYTVLPRREGSLIINASSVGYDSLVRE